MLTTDIHQQLVFATDANDLYDCLMNARKHSSFTADIAIIEDLEETNFTTYSGYIHGTNKVLERGRKIIQTWRANEPEWPVGYFSEVALLIENTAIGCKVECFHSGVPQAVAAKIEVGWHQYYWEPLTIYLER